MEGTDPDSSRVVGSIGSVELEDVCYAACCESFNSGAVDKEDLGQLPVSEERRGRRD